MYSKILPDYRLKGDVFLDDFLSKNKNFDKLPEKQFKKLPIWADKNKIQIAQNFFHKNFRVILSLLGSLSLPYCYAAADGAKILVHSQRLLQDTRRRLAETAYFIIEIMQKNSLEENGNGLEAIFQVRKMHSQVRKKILDSKRWNLDWGFPINQEDMAGTNLSFSLLILRGMEKLQYPIQSEEKEAYLHFWNVVGYLSGVSEELLPKDAKEAFWLDKCIVERQFKTSTEGKLLTKNLLLCLSESLPKNLPDGFLSSYLRFLLGTKVSNMLNIPPSNWTINLLTPLPLVSWWQDLTQNMHPDEMKNLIQESMK